MLEVGSEIAVTRQPRARLVFSTHLALNPLRLNTWEAARSALHSPNRLTPEAP